MTTERPRLTYGPLSVDLNPYGARTTALRFHDRDLILPTPEAFDPFGVWSDAGAIVGPVGNRITTGDHLPGWDGPTDGQVMLHGDTEGMQAGTQHLAWETGKVTPRSALFTLELPVGHGGFKAHRSLAVRYTLPRTNALRIVMEAQTDSPTLMSLTHHPYWALGPGTGIADHRLQVLARNVLPIDAQTRPTGEVMPVAGTEYDFNIPRALIPGAPDLDNTYCLSNARLETERAVAYLEAPDGWAMELWTNEPGLVVFDGRITDGFGLAPYAGCCLEPQMWPDAPRHPHFPKVTFAPGQISRTIIEYRFKVGSGQMRTNGTSQGL
ncbi:aldose epimerase family protein [Primorskyibacter sp. S187A]|uniref:aldose epimerase family protein n=1 Tax=Primorskyibacter sp. S187A TaxID=3415130 RepID=UPI003C7DC816